MWLWIPLIAVLIAALVIVAWFFAWRGTRLRYLRANSLVAQTSRGRCSIARKSRSSLGTAMHPLPPSSARASPAAPSQPRVDPPTMPGPRFINSSSRRTQVYSCGSLYTCRSININGPLAQSVRAADS